MPTDRANDIRLQTTIYPEKDDQPSVKEIDNASDRLQTTMDPEKDELYSFVETDKIPDKPQTTEDPYSDNTAKQDPGQYYQQYYIMERNISTILKYGK